VDGKWVEETPPAAAAAAPKAAAAAAVSVLSADGPAQPTYEQLMSNDALLILPQQAESIVCIPAQ
jgi:hypothetical protein